MSEEMKLIKALIDALGFDVEVTRDRKEKKIDHEQGVILYNSGRFETDRKLIASGIDGLIDVDKDGMVTSYLIEPEISYKLTKRGN